MIVKKGNLTGFAEDLKNAMIKNNIKLITALSLSDHFYIKDNKLYGFGFEYIGELSI